MGRKYVSIKLAILLGLVAAAVLTRDTTGTAAERMRSATASKLGAAQLWAEQQSGAMLVPGVNTPGDEYGPTLAPDGRELCYTTRQVREKEESIVCAKGNGTTWKDAKTTSFSGNKGLDKEPYISPDGTRMYFASQRAHRARTGAVSWDLFVVERRGEDWGTPQPIEGDVNTAGYENYPAVSASGTLYFARRNDGTQNDLYAARVSNGRYHAIRLPNGVNTAHTDADPYVAPDESYIIFSSDRPGGLGEGDLYITRRAAEGWSAPKPLGPKVNSADYEYTPFVSPDGEWLYFSRGWGDIWRIRLSELPSTK